MTVVVKVCNVSGQLAGDWCPTDVVVDRRFYVDPRPGEPVKPVSTCNVHEKPEEIPQADTSEPRTGVDVYQLIAFPLDQIRQYMDDLVKNGGSVLRVFMVYSWPVGVDTAGWNFSIFPQVGWWTETEGAFAGTTSPIFDLDQWNEEIWSKWRAVFALAKERRIRLTLSVLDGCSLYPLNARYNPLIMNRQHHGAEPGGPIHYKGLDGQDMKGLGIHTGGVYGGFGGDNGDMKARMAALARKVAFEVIASGVDYRIMPGNEMQAPIEGPWTNQEKQDAILREYLSWWVYTLIESGVPEDRIVLSIAGTHDRARVTVPLVAAYPGVVEQLHGPNSPETLSAWPPGCY